MYIRQIFLKCSEQTRTENTLYMSTVVYILSLFYVI